MAEVELNDITKSFGAIDVIKGVSLDIEQGEFCVFVGPSGCGKSTLLRLVAGLEDITSGTLRIRGEVVNEVPPSKRGIAMVFQSYALYPHMTVYNNMAFGMKLARASREEIDRQVRKAAEILQLTPLLDRLPKQLSGGQRQRVAIGRAIVREPVVFLFDEPLSNLDAALRTQMRIEIGTLHNALRATMIYVTHDQVEAMTMADKIVVLNAGRVEQVGAPLELYHRPANLFVAGFIGSPKMNIIKTRVAEAGGGLARIDLPGGGDIGVPLEGARVESGAPILLGVRPEHLMVGNSVDGQIPGKVRLAEHLGAETILYVDVPGAEPLLVRSDGLTREKAGDNVKIGVAATSCHLFSPDGPALVNGAMI
jgi:multiple sugar transport system ATP-binding protein